MEKQIQELTEIIKESIDFQVEEIKKENQEIKDMLKNFNDEKEVENIEDKVKSDFISALLSNDSNTLLSSELKGFWKELVKKAYSEIVWNFYTSNNLKLNTININSPEIVLRRIWEWITVGRVGINEAVEFSTPSTKQIELKLKKDQALVNLWNYMQTPEIINVLENELKYQMKKHLEKQIFNWKWSWNDRLGILNDTTISEILLPADKTSLKDLTLAEMDLLLDKLKLSVPSELREGANYFLSDYEMSVLANLRKPDGTAAYPDLIDKWVIKNTPVIVISEKTITSEDTDTTGIRWILYWNLYTWYSDYVDHSKSDISLVYINNWPVTGIKTLKIDNFSVGQVSNPKAFAVSKNN